MSMNDGGPAFPVHPDGRGQGMSLRDYFAAKAMQACIATPQVVDALVKKGGNPMAVLANASYTFADAMIAERDTPRGE